MPSASCQEIPSPSAASATAWMLCFDTPSDLAIAFRDVPAASCCSIGLALILLAMLSPLSRWDMAGGGYQSQERAAACFQQTVPKRNNRLAASWC